MAGEAAVRAQGRERTWKVALVALLLLAPGWIFRDVLLGRRVFYSQDVLAYVEPKNVEYLRALGEGRFPLWLSAIGCGVPFFAEIDNAVLNPFNLLLALGARRAVEFGAPLWCALAALFMAAWLREWQVKRAAAAIGGLGYGLSGLLVFYFDNPPYLNAAMWLPLLLLCWHRAIARGSPLWVGLSGAVAFLAITTGDLQTVYDGALLVLPYGLFVPVDGGRRPLRALGYGLGLGVATAALAAVQLLPTFELLRQAPRLLPREMVYEWSFHPGRLLELLLPFGYGADLPGLPYWGGFLHQATSPTPWTRSVYLGLLPLVVLPWAFGERARRPLALFLSAAGGLALLASFGEKLPVYELLYRVLPLFDRFRVPSKLWVVVSLAVAGLGALGADRLLDGGRGMRVVVLALALSLALGAVAFAPLPPAPAATLRAPALHAALVASLLAAVLALRDRLGDRAGLLLALVVAFDLGRVNGNVAHWFTTREVAPEAPVAAARAILDDARSEPGPFRIYHHQSLVEGRGWHPPAGLILAEQRKLWDRVSLDWNHAWRWGLEEAAGYTVLQDGRPLGFRSAAGADPEGLVTALGRINVRYLLLAKGSPLPPGTGLVADVEEGAVRVLRIEESMPRVFLARFGRAVPDPAEALAALFHPGFDPRAFALLESEQVPFPGAPSDAPLGQLSVERYQPGRVDVTVELPEPRYLLLGEARYQGWVAYVDGVRRDTIRANYLMQAVPLRPGEHRVELRYQPLSFRVGLGVSAIAWSALGAALLVTLRRSRRSELAP